MDAREDATPLRVGAGLPPDESLAQRLREMVHHTAVYGLGPVLGQIAAFLLLPLYTNLLSPSSYGTLEIITLVGNILNPFVSLHAAIQTLRLYHAAESEQERKEVVSTAIIFTGVLTAAAIIPADIFRHRISTALFGTDANAHLLRLAFWSLVAANVLAVALAYLQVRKMSRAFTILSVAQLLCVLLLNLALVAWLDRGVEGILLSQLLVTGTFGLGLALWVLGRTGVAFSFGKVREMLVFGIPLIGWSLAVFVVNAADRVVLSGVGSLTDVGLYSLANRFATALLVFIVTPFSRFWAAERFAVAKKEDGRGIIARVFTYFFVLLCFSGLSISVWMDEVIRLMAAEQFWSAARIGPILVLAYVLWGTFDYFMTGVLIVGRTRGVGFLMWAAALLHVALCAALGWAFLSAGVAWAKVITLGVLSMGVYGIAQRLYPIRYELRRIAKVLAVSVTLFAAGSFLDGYPPLLGIAMKTTFVLAFPFALACVGFLDGKEKRWITAHAKAIIGKLYAVEGA